MCLCYAITKANMQAMTTKNLNKPFYAWKVINAKTLRSPYRRSAMWIPGKLMRRRSIAKTPIIHPVVGCTGYENGIHLLLTRVAARDYVKSLRYRPTVSFKAIKVLVNPQSVVAWGRETGKPVVVVRSCRICE